MVGMLRSSRLWSVGPFRHLEATTLTSSITNSVRVESVFRRTMSGLTYTEQLADWQNISSELRRSPYLFRKGLHRWEVALSFQKGPLPVETDPDGSVLRG